MTRSMTAFARRETQTVWGALTWEMRSVNHRYLEVHTRLPDELRGLETPLRERVGARLKRGKVECMLRFQPAAAAAAGFSLNRDVLGRVVDAAREIEAVLPNPGPIAPLDVLRWPGVIEAAQVDQDELYASVLALLDQALDEMVETRLREGVRIQEFITQRCTGIAGQVVQVRKRLPEIGARHRERLLARLGEIKDQLDPQRLEQELVIYAQRVDVEEELDRLETHVAEVQRVLSQEEAVGRRLDFLMQELNREANTLGSKSMDADMTRASVEIKVFIEQMREQVQNIE